MNERKMILKEYAVIPIFSTFLLFNNFNNKSNSNNNLNLVISGTNLIRGRKKRETGSTSH